MNLLNNKTWRFIDSGAHDGAFNMAADEMLARRSRAETPVLRFFVWQPYTLSVGYHQPLTEVDLTRCHTDRIGVVRRPTGGRAIFHAEELTYSVVIPEKDALFHHNSQEIYNRISTALVAGLRELGLPARVGRSEGSSNGFKKYNNRFACFSTSIRYEIQCQNKKLVGSAQRRFDRSVLQHGSVLTGEAHLRLLDYVHINGIGEISRARERLAAQTTTVSSILGQRAAFSDVARALRSGFEKTFAIRLVQEDLSGSELQKINQLRHDYLIEEVVC